MFDKIIEKLYLAQLKKKQLKIKQEQEKNASKQKQEFLRLLKELYAFVSWLNKRFANRNQRRLFWKEVAAGRPVFEETLKNLINQYKQK